MSTTFAPLEIGLVVMVVAHSCRKRGPTAGTWRCSAVRARAHLWGCLHARQGLDKQVEIESDCSVRTHMGFRWAFIARVNAPMLSNSLLLL
jgi:hypothetical protein